jgi:hypothetical protein
MMLIKCCAGLIISAIRNILMKANWIESKASNNRETTSCTCDVTCVLCISIAAFAVLISLAAYPALFQAGMGHGDGGQPRLERVISVSPEEKIPVTRGGVVINELSQPAYGDATVVTRGGIAINNVHSAVSEGKTVLVNPVSAGSQNTAYGVITLLIAALATGTLLTIHERRKYGVALAPRME